MILCFLDYLSCHSVLVLDIELECGTEIIVRCIESSTQGEVTFEDQDDNLQWNCRNTNTQMEMPAAAGAGKKSVLDDVVQKVQNLTAK